MKRLSTLVRGLRKHGVSLRGQRTEIVVFGYAETVPLFSKFVDGKTIQLFDPTYRAKLYLVPFLSAIARKLLSRTDFSITHHYFVYFLRRARPKVVLSNSDSNFDLWSSRLALADVQIAFGIFQQGWRREIHVPQTKMLGRNDIVCCLSEASINTYKTAAGSARLLPLGSLRSKLANEEMILDVQPQKNKRASFISEWRPGKVTNGRHYVHSQISGDWVEAIEAYKSELDILPKIASIIQKKGMKFHVLGAFSNLAMEECTFYESILGPQSGNWEFLARSPQETNYARLHDYVVSFSVSSTLGYEALAEGHKVIFPQSTDLGGLRHAFAYPNHQALAASLIHLRRGAENEWESQISEVLTMSSGDYEKLAREVVGSQVMQTRAEDIRNVISELFQDE